ncbi:MAG: hypothetical protein QX197_05485 [Methylococcaceae bacterium]
MKLVVQVAGMTFTAELSSKSYRKAMASITELAAENCTTILQGSLLAFASMLQATGLVVQSKKAKEDT